jgi:hypothetical protein
VRHLPQFLQSESHQLGLLAVGAAFALGFVVYSFVRRKPDPAEIERRRRLFLSEHGRITDANLLDSNLADQNLAESATSQRAEDFSQPGEPLPAVLLYHYRVSGVTYESAQDVSLLADYVRHVRIDLPIQVRYDPHNPSNSIVVSEAWSGLRLDPEPPPGTEPRATEH